MMALGKGFGAEGGPGGGPGAGGGMPAMGGGGGDMGGMGGPPGGDMGGMGGMGGPPGGDGGAAPIGAPGGGGGGPIVAKSTALTVDVADPGQFGGRVLKKKTRETIQNEQQKIYNQKMKNQVDSYGQQRDEKGRIIFTKPERQLIAQMTQYIKDGLIKYKIQPQYRLQAAGQEYPIDFAIERLRLGIEADGEMFHGTPEQQTKDKERDLKLNQIGWTIIRFQDDEIEKRPQQVMATILQEIAKKEEFMKKQVAQAQQAKAAQTEALVKEAASAMEALMLANTTVTENDDDSDLDMDIGDISNEQDPSDKNLGE
jgi:very-short-patch-repair endonuclease